MRALPLLVGLVLLPAANAAISATLLSYDEDAMMDGRLELLHLRFGDGGQGSPWLQASAARIEAIQYNAPYLVTDQPPGQQPLTYQEKTPVADRQDLGAGSLRLVGSHGVARLLAYAPSGVEMQGSTSEGSIVARGPVVLNGNGLHVVDGTEPATCSGDRPDLPEFCTLERDGPLLLHTTDGASASVALRAPFLVLELYGLDVRVDAARDLTLATGRFPEEVGPVAGPVHREHDVFLRIFLTDASIEVATDGPGGLLQWAGTNLRSSYGGPATLSAAQGPYQTQEGIIDLNDERFVLPAGSRLALTPLQHGRMEIVDRDTSAPLATAPDVSTTTASLAVLAFAFMLPLAAFAAWMLLRRRNATLPAMEAAIAAGRHRRAAALAGAILRREPGQEDARLGRAIALTKTGRHARAAREVQEHLGVHDPSDGSLHYVLGLALLETGRAKEGREALREAVRRTPALEADVRARALDALPPAARAQGFKEGYSYV